MKYIWPILVGAVLLVSIYLTWQCLGRYASMYALAVLLLMPITVITIQGRGGKTFAFGGFVVGAICGIVVGYYFGPIISELIHGPIPTEFNIRIDLVMWWILFASFFASCFAALAGRLGRARSLN